MQRQFLWDNLLAQRTFLFKMFLDDLENAKMMTCFSGKIMEGWDPFLPDQISSKEDKRKFELVAE